MSPIRKYRGKAVIDICLMSAAQALNRLEFYNNADAGADMAAQMLRLLQQLDGVPSLADITMIIKVGFTLSSKPVTGICSLVAQSLLQSEVVLQVLFS